MPSIDAMAKPCELDDGLPQPVDATKNKAMSANIGTSLVIMRYFNNLPSVNGIVRRLYKGGEAAQSAI
jgi:hypothetical protein